jgi:hypothetical protein
VARIIFAMPLQTEMIIRLLSLIPERAALIRAKFYASGSQAETPVIEIFKWDGEEIGGRIEQINDFIRRGRSGFVEHCEVRSRKYTFVNDSRTTFWLRHWQGPNPNPVIFQNQKPASFGLWQGPNPNPSFSGYQQLVDYPPAISIEGSQSGVVGAFVKECEGLGLAILFRED